MKWNSIIIAVLGLIVVAAAALAFLHLGSSGQSSPGGNAVAGAGPTPVPPPTRTDVLDRFAILRDKINASGLNYGGAALQLVNGEETAMAYMYLPAGLDDVSGMLSAGFSALYATFDSSKDPLLVGLVDTTQKISASQFKVDIYALERSVVADFLAGNMTAQELKKKAILVTPDTTSLHADGSVVKKAVNVSYPRPANYTAPANRTMIFDDYLQQGGYALPAGFQAGTMADGTSAVSVTMPLKTGATAAERYAEIEDVLKACAVGYGDYDRYLISLIPTQEGVYDYYSIDAAAPPAIAFADGDISEYQLYKAINMTYYTK